MLLSNRGTLISKLITVNIEISKVFAAFLTRLNFHNTQQKLMKIYTKVEQFVYHLFIVNVYPFELTLLYKTGPCVRLIHVTAAFISMI